MSCPRCDYKYLKEQINLHGILLWKKKKVTTYCPACQYTNIHEFSISSIDKQLEIKDKIAYIERKGNTKQYQTIRTNNSYTNRNNKRR